MDAFVSFLLGGVPWIFAIWFFLEFQTMRRLIRDQKELSQRLVNQIKKNTAQIKKLEEEITELKRR